MKNMHEILKVRAKETARPMEKTVSGGGFDVIRFGVGNETYAIEAEVLSEVQRYREPTPVPYLPEHMLGIVYVRGRFVSVIDLKRFLEIGGVSKDDAHSILLLDDGKMEFAIVVDEVFGERKLASDAVQPVTQGFVLKRQDLVTGVTEDGTVVLDARRLLKEPSMLIHQEVTTTHQGGEHA